MESEKTMETPVPLILPVVPLSRRLFRAAYINNGFTVIVFFAVSIVSIVGMIAVDIVFEDARVPMTSDSDPGTAFVLTNEQVSSVMYLIGIFKFLLVAAVSSLFLVSQFYMFGVLVEFYAEGPQSGTFGDLDVYV
jgi:hypothetical protein